MTRDEKINVIRRLKNDGVTDQAIAEKLNLSESAVLRLRQKGGIAGLPSAGRKKGSTKKHGDAALRTHRINLIKAAWRRVVDRAFAEETHS